MSLAEEMLATMPASDDSSTYLSEEEPHIIIDNSRTAFVPSSLKTIAVTGDHEVEKITFDCVRFWDGNDLSTFAIYLNYVLPDLSTGTYIPSSIVADDNVFHFDWDIKNNITKKSGKIAFAITAIKTKKNDSGETVVDKQWSSIPNGDCSIVLGIDISNVPSEEESSDVLAQMSDILEQMRPEINAIKSDLSKIKTFLVDNYFSDTLNLNHFGSGMICGGVTNGVPNTGKYRVCTKTPIRFDSDVYFYIEKGRRCAFHLFNDDLTFKSDSGWMYGSYFLEANTPFISEISNYTETTSEEMAQVLTADDISDFLSYVTVKKISDIFTIKPEMRNGSLGNPGNADAVGFTNTVKIKDTAVVLKYDLNLEEGEKIRWVVYTYDSISKPTATAVLEATYRIYDEDKETYNNFVICDFSEAIRRGKKAYGVSLFVVGADGNVISQRVGVNAKDIEVISVKHHEELSALFDIDTKTTIQREDLLTAQKSRFAGTAITIAHLTDIHSDKSAYKRIVNDIKTLGNAVNGAICTGDIVGSTSAEDISSWWTSDVMSCIGNHDSATYDSSTGYDWTSLTMSQRSSKYIEPWESDWGIVHTAGTSYYYKDYPNAYVRMIVLDNMLYMSNDNLNDAQTQTDWLAETMESARLLGYHILIAVHAVHGGSIAVPCSFSKYGSNASTVMPTLTDCDLPPIVITTVANAIRNGCVFIGYLCGHYHQDMIWDATGDKTQLMYCLTCTNQNYQPQWESADLARRGINDSPLDAYNLVTIETNRNLIKIVRCGGANVDIYMRERKYICIDYSTGAIICE